MSFYGSWSTGNSEVKVKYMKLFCGIWIVIILAFQFAPCSDIAQISKGNDFNVVQNNIADPINHTDGCTPFCYCFCCSMPSCSLPETLVEFINKETASVYTQRTDGKFIDVSYSIWQPPRLS
ncbi:MAG: hypothetical protein EOP48_02740 [Sphingobacteriales bacterium]|nr:MAG: hypothetical protein EOP48_02740 [Sphingobacteriales bacterium]